jgi:hypothetical protein
MRSADPVDLAEENAKCHHKCAQHKHTKYARHDAHGLFVALDVGADHLLDFVFGHGLDNLVLPHGATTYR